MTKFSFVSLIWRIREQIRKTVIFPKRKKEAQKPSEHHNLLFVVLIVSIVF